MQSRAEIVPVDDGPAFWQDQSAVRSCLLESPPRLPAWFGYDAIGSQLFEEITKLPAYYLAL